MSYNYAGVDTWHAQIPLPEDGDPAIAASVDVALEDLLDNDVVNRTDISHQSMDDRGDTHTVTGPIILNDGGGSVSFNLPFEVTQQSDLDVTHFHGDVVVLTGSDFQVNDNATIGNTGTDQLDVYARTDHYGTTVFHEDVVVTTGDELKVHGTVLFDGPTTTIQSPLNQIGLDDDSSTSVAGTLTVGVNAVVAGQLITLGNATLGNSSTDDHTIEGHLGLEGDLHVTDALTVDGAAELNNGVDIHGTAQLFSHLTVAGNTTIGNSSSDTITTNALLATPLGFTSAGRVPQRPTLGPDANTSVTVTSANLVFVPFAGLTATRTYALEDGSVTGDEVLFSSQDTANLLVINPASGSSASIKATTLNVPVWIRFVWFGSIWYAVERSG